MTDREVKKHEKQIRAQQDMLEAAFVFIREVWENGQELLVYDQEKKLTTEVRMLMEV